MPETHGNDQVGYLKTLYEVGHLSYATILLPRVHNLFYRNRGLMETRSDYLTTLINWTTMEIYFKKYIVLNVISISFELNIFLSHRRTVCGWIKMS